MVSLVRNFRRKKIALLVAGVLSVTIFSGVLQFGVHSNRTPSSESDAVLAKQVNPNVAAPQSAMAPTELRQNEAQIVGLSPRESVLQAWGAGTSEEVWNLLKNADFSGGDTRILLDTVRATCKDAQKPHNGIPVSASSAIAASNAKATDIFVARYCGDVELLVARIDAALAPGEADLKRRYFESIKQGVEFVGKPQPKNREDLQKLIVASATSALAADAVINEMLTEKNPYTARSLTRELALSSESGRSLAAWNDFLPPDVSRADRIRVFSIAGELNICSRVRGCEGNRPLTIYECPFPGQATCYPNEDLLSYRRRTTSPMLYQAAEQIAAAMRARRYR
jgi:hypothetical protein